MPVEPLEHFIKRAKRYDRSSHWINDRALIEKIYELADITSDASVLDVAIGTGKIAETFYRKARYVVGIDICLEMVQAAGDIVDSIVFCRGEGLCFKDNTFDVCVCRQGLQFMEVPTVLEEMQRVLKPGGRIVSCHLTAYNEKDKETAFLIQRLRNPARKNFFLPEDLLNAYKAVPFTAIEFFEYISRESVNQWIDNGAIAVKQMEKIKDIYRTASEDFKRIHHIEFKDGDILDSMKMLIIKGTKR